jgi:hypothetical protein
VILSSVRSFGPHRVACSMETSMPKKFGSATTIFEIISMPV